MKVPEKGFLGCDIGGGEGEDEKTMVGQFRKGFLECVGGVGAGDETTTVLTSDAGCGSSLRAFKRTCSGSGSLENPCWERSCTPSPSLSYSPTIRVAISRILVADCN